MNAESLTRQKEDGRFAGVLSEALRIARRDPIEHHSSPRETGVGLRDGQETNYAIPTLRQVIRARHRVDVDLQIEEFSKSSMSSVAKPKG